MSTASTSASASYSTFVRQLDSSPSQSRRYSNTLASAANQHRRHLYHHDQQRYHLHKSNLSHHLHPTTTTKIMTNGGGGGGGGGKHYSGNTKVADNFVDDNEAANSTFDSAFVTESNSYNKSDYSNSYYQHPVQPMSSTWRSSSSSSSPPPPPMQQQASTSGERDIASGSPLHSSSVASVIARFETIGVPNQASTPTIPEYESNTIPLRSKVSFGNTVARFPNPAVTSKTANNNYFTLSEVENNDSECGSHSVADSSCKPLDKPCDKFGFFIESDDDADYDAKTPTAQDLKNIRQREKKWLQMLNNWKYYINFKWEKIRDRCRKGIPHSLRSQAWFYLCGGHIQKRRHPRLYADLLKRDVPEDICSDIQKDLHRQFPMHELFADRDGPGQTGLANVLKAFAAFKPKIGYCQAQGPIASVLLMHMPAEHAFWSLVALSDYYIGGYFIHNLEEIEIHGQMLFAFVKKFSPNAYHLLKRQNIEPVLYMTEWFMCIYSRNLPWPSVLRVWDMFLCEGVTVLFKVGIYLVDVSLRNENTKTCPSMYETCQKLRNIPKQFLLEESLLKGLKHIELKDSDLLREHKIQLKKYRKTKSRYQLGGSSSLT